VTEELALQVPTLSIGATQENLLEIASAMIPEKSLWRVKYYVGSNKNGL
jgi:hypothetical protein